MCSDFLGWSSILTGRAKPWYAAFSAVLIAACGAAERDVQEGDGGSGGAAATSGGSTAGGTMSGGATAGGAPMAGGATTGGASTGGTSGSAGDAGGGASGATGGAGDTAGAGQAGAPAAGETGSGGEPGTGGVGGAGGEGGTGGACDTPQTQCASGCTDLATDALNCGSCGHDCMQGACISGKCQPATLATIENTYGVELGLSPDFVLVAGTSPIYTVNKTTGAVKMTRAHRTDSSWALQLWGTRSTLVSIEEYSPANAVRYFSHCSLGDCRDSDPAVDSFTFNKIWAFAADTATSAVYWFDPTSGELMTTHADTWTPRSVGAATKAPVTYDGGSAVVFPRSMSIQSGRVYGTFEYALYAIALSGTAAPVAVSAYPEGTTAFDTTLATTPNSLLVLNQVSGSIYRVPIPNGIGNQKPDQVQGPSGAKNMATVGSTLYWSGSTTVLSCTPPACTDQQTVATDDATIMALAADQDAIYWLSWLREGTTDTTWLKRLAR